MIKPLLKRLGLYWPLIKSLQTGLLLSTGIAGYMTARCPVVDGWALAQLIVTLVLAISGSTVLNMWYDRDLDRVMNRTHHRPIASGRVLPREALTLGLVLSAVGVGWALALDMLYGMVVLAGLVFDVVVYTIWLKRRTPWSIVWGGLAGGMPVLAGRVLGLTSLEAAPRLDWIGLLLALAVLFWIPTHILTFAMRYHTDYQAARIPTFPSCFGFDQTRKVIAVSSVLAAAAIGLAAVILQIEWGYLHLLGAMSGGLVILASFAILRPSPRLNFGLFKYASVYMLFSMLLLSI